MGCQAHPLGMHMEVGMVADFGRKSDTNVVRQKTQTPKILTRVSSSKPGKQKAKLSVSY